MDRNQKSDAMHPSLPSATRIEVVGEKMDDPKFDLVNERRKKQNKRKAADASN